MRPLLTIPILLGAIAVHGQQVVDTCFTSANASTSFLSSGDLANEGPGNSDLLEWNGSEWTGAWPNAHITIPPPTGGIGCRAVFIGANSGWTSGGEGFGLRLTAPLVAGVSYTYTFTYVSHGTASNGNFGPKIYTAPSPALTHWVADLPPVGTNWTTNDFTFTASAAQAGDTWLMITTAPDISSGMISSFCSQCSGQDPVPTCTVELGPDTTLCEGASLLLDVTTAEATYLWQDDSTGPTFTVTDAGTYWVQVTVDNCTATDSIEVGYTAPPLVDLGSDQTLCEGTTTSLDATTPEATYLWQDASTAAEFTVNAPGTYWVEVTVGACTVADTVHVAYAPVPLLDLGPDLVLCPDDGHTLNAETPGASGYLWHDGSTEPMHPVIEDGVYWVQVTVNNCSVADTVLVLFGDCGFALEMPNVFTPNHDGTNNLFKPIRFLGITDGTLQIINRWGQVIHETGNIRSGWDGTTRGQKCPEGTYYWVIRYTTKTGETDTLTGVVTLLR